jgi:hypothetical protein
MRREQVPQDNENLLEGRTRDVCYAVDENGNYVQVLSTGWEPKNAALRQAWEQIDQQAKKTYSLVKKGKVSPLAFFMVKGMFDAELLSEYTHIPKRMIKAHLQPERFRRLDDITLGKYAEAFNVTVDELVNGPRTSDAFPGKTQNGKL